MGAETAAGSGTRGKKGEKEEKSGIRRRRRRKTSRSLSFFIPCLFSLLVALYHWRWEREFCVVFLCISLYTTMRFGIQRVFSKEKREGGGRKKKKV